MFRLLKLGVGMIALAAVAWFGITVKLGPRTLFQHLRAIGQTRESQELVDGTKQAAGPLVDDVRRRISGKSEDDESSRSHGDEAKKPASKSGTAPASDEPAAPQERLSSSEQRQLRELLRKVGR